VLCLRPQADFARVDALPPASLAVDYRAPTDADVTALMRQAAALVIPAVGPKLPSTLFEATTLKLVQVTGAGLDRLDIAALTQSGIPIANVPGGSNSALAEYAVAVSSLLLRRFGWADAEIKRGNYAAYRARLIADNLAGLEGLLIGVVGLGTIGLAVARAFAEANCRVCYYDPAPADPQAARNLGGAAVDVYSTEPPSADNPLLGLDGEAGQRLLLTPHIAGVTRQSAAFLFRTAWQNVERVLIKGEAALYRAN
jgi:phosphoglycerate dehydrogenase-like enzyme